MHGKGKITLPNGDVYIGLFEDGFKHGKGYLKKSDGNYEEVEYMHDIRVHSYKTEPSSVHSTCDEETKAFYIGNGAFYHRESDFQLSSDGGRRASYTTKTCHRLNSTADDEGNSFRSRLNKKLREKRCFKQIEESTLGKENNIPKQKIRASFLINQEWSETLDEDNDISGLMKSREGIPEKYLSIIEPTNVDSMRLTESERRGEAELFKSSVADNDFLQVKPTMITSEAVHINQSRVLASHLRHNGLGFQEGLQKSKGNFGEIMDFISQQKAYFYPETHIEIKNKSALKHVCPYEIEEMDDEEQIEDINGRDTFEWDFMK